jgi:hypothetical protein
MDSSIDPQFIKSIQWNDDKPDSTNLNDWFSKTVNQNKQKNTITVTPLFGSPVVYTVNYKPAPALTVSGIEHGNGSVGLDNYELYKKLDNQNKFKGYYTETYTSNGVDYHVSYIIVTEYTEQLTFTVKAMTEELINGKCVYDITHSENTVEFDEQMSLLPDGSCSVECKGIPLSGYFIITDEAGEIKCKIKIINAKAEFGEKFYSYRIVRFKYNEKTNTLSQDKVGKYINRAFAQLNVVWSVQEKEKEIIVNETDINATVQKTKNPAITVSKAKQWLLGNSIRKEDVNAYKEFLTDIYQRNKEQPEQSSFYDIILMPNSIGINGFATLGGKYCFISPEANEFTIPHELGHNLGLEHPGNELGVCTGEEEENDCELNQVKTNNIMGYNGYQRNSFWLWQRLKLKK